MLRSQGGFEDAHTLDTEIWRKQQEVLGEDHPSTLLTAGSLGGDLRGLGRFREALELDEETYSRNKELLGPDDPNTLSSANNLGVDLRLVGDCFRARDLDRETLNYRQVVLGPDHPYTLHSASMLARDMREAGDYAGSVDLLRKPTSAIARSSARTSWTPCAPRKSLAVSLRKVGRLDEAYTLTKEIDERYERSYGADHPDSLACKLNLACDLSARDEKNAAALEVASQVLEAYQRLFGGGHPFTLGGREQHLDLPARRRHRAGGARARGPDAGARCGTRSARTTRSRSPAQINKANCLHDLAQLQRGGEPAAGRPSSGCRRPSARSIPTRRSARRTCRSCCAPSGGPRRPRRSSSRSSRGWARPLGNDHPSVAALREWRLQNRDLEAQPT